MCACPYGTFLRARRATPRCCLRRPILPPTFTVFSQAAKPGQPGFLYLRLLLACTTAAATARNGLLGTLARARVRLGPLTVHRQIAAVPHTTIAANLDQALDV